MHSIICLETTEGQPAYQISDPYIVETDRDRESGAESETRWSDEICAFTGGGWRENTGKR